MKAFLTHPATVFVGGVLVGHMLTKFIAKIPLVNRLPQPLPPA